MATKFIQHMQQSTSWKLNGNSIIGQKDGHWFTVSQAGSIQPILVTTAVAGLQSIALDQVKSAVLAKKKAYKLNRFENQGHVLNIYLNADTNAEKNIARVNELLQDLSAEFTRLGLANACHVCGFDVPVNTVRIGQNTAAVCPACQAKLQAEFAGIVEKNTAEGSYFTGIIGALLGALIGAALWLLVSYLGFYASIVGFVMAFLAQTGYRLFKGKIQRGMPVIILLAVILGILAANAVEIAIGLAQDPEIGLTFWQALQISPQAFYNTEYFYVGRVWGNVAVALLFALLGSWRTVKELFSESKGDIYQIEQI